MTLAQVPVEGGEEVRFGNLPTGAHAEISPDGKQMAFSYYDRDKPSQHTCIAPVDAAAPEKCFELSRSFPRWVADGTAFYYLDHGYSGVWRQPVSGTRTEFVKFAGERTNNFAFSRDGKAMVVARSTATQDIVAITDEQ
jgi:Tol biopolymer transport system component